VELQHKASMPRRKKFGTSTQSFNALEKKAWNFNPPKQRTWSFNTKLQCTKEESLEFQHKTSTHKLTRDPRELQCTKVENLKPQHKASTHLSRNLRVSM